MKKHVLAVGIGALLCASSAFAADLYEPQPEQPMYEAPAPEPAPAAGGWYLRGDIGYAFNDLDNAYYFPGGFYSTFDSVDLDDSFLLGGGVGYQVSDYLRVDVTGDYLFDADFKGTTSAPGCNIIDCASTERGSVRMFSLLANAYVDLGTYHGVTPYVGAGVGGTHVNWDDFTTETNCVTCSGGEPGSSNWRFTYAVMAGASVDLTCNLAVDAGYRYRHVNEGEIFGDVPGAGRGYDDGIDVHEARAGLRYTFGGCDQPAPVYASYEAPAPVYK